MGLHKEHKEVLKIKNLLDSAFEFDFDIYQFVDDIILMMNKEGFLPLLYGYREKIFEAAFLKGREVGGYKNIKEMIEWAIQIREEILVQNITFSHKDLYKKINTKYVDATQTKSRYTANGSVEEIYEFASEIDLVIPKYSYGIEEGKTMENIDVIKELVKLSKRRVNLPEQIMIVHYLIGFVLSYPAMENTSNLLEIINESEEFDYNEGGKFFIDISLMG